MSPRLEDLHRSSGRHLRAEGKSERTVVIYGQAIMFFSAWLEAQGHPATVDELDRPAIREWLAQLVDVNEAHGWPLGQLRTIKRFLAATDGLTQGMDTVVSNHLARLFGRASPW